MADMFAPLVAQLKANPKTIVFTEGNDPRILEAASKLLAEGVLKVVMVGNEAECKAAAAAGNFDISAAEIIDPENYAGFDEMVNTMVELRKGKQTAEECTALLKKSNYFGTMLVKMGKADCLLGGATYSTADTVRPALQLVKTKPGNKIVSSCMILVRTNATGGSEVIAMGDCAINIDPTADELVEIAGIADVLDYTISGHECSAFKPDPEIYLRAMEALGVEPTECLVIEDSPLGIEAGKRSGARVLALRPHEGVNLDQSAADTIIDNLTDILPAI